MAEKQKEGSSAAGSDGGVTIPKRENHPGLIPASPPRFISLNELMDTTNLVQNMKLVHEIVLDDEFELEKPKAPQGSIEQQVSDTMRRAFWDMLTEKLSQTPPDFSQALLLITDVKEMLLKCLLPQQQRLKNKIEEVLDMELIKQKVENDAFDITYYADFVRNLMAQFCCPARDEDIAKLKDITETVPLFKEILRMLEVMNLDMANYTIREMRPFLKEQSIQYEKEMFEEFLTKQETSGVDGLEYTREWLERSHDALTGQTGNEIFYTNLTSINVTPVNILHGAFMELLNWSGNIFPETCLMDQKRFIDIAYNLRKLAFVSSTLLVAFTHVGDKLTGHTKLRERLKEEVLALLVDTPESEYPEKIVNIAEHVSLEVSKELEALDFGPLNSEQLAEYKSKLVAAGDRSHPVHTLLWKRIMTFIWQSLGHSGSQPLQLPQGLGVVSTGIAFYCGKYLKLTSHNKAVFGARYADLVATLMNVTDLSPRVP